MATPRAGAFCTANRKPARPCASRVPWLWPRAESNRRHGDFQSPALPTELPGPTSLFPVALRGRASPSRFALPALQTPAGFPALLPARLPALRPPPRPTPTILQPQPSLQDNNWSRPVWANQESNLGPLACKASALPLSYSPINPRRQRPSTGRCRTRSPEPFPRGGSPSRVSRTRSTRRRHPARRPSGCGPAGGAAAQYTTRNPRG